MKICNMKSGIYKITNPSGKIYIGMSKCIEKRFAQYKRLQCKKQKAIYNSFLKYGVENHTFEIVELCENLKEKEKFYINFFNSYNNGLNQTLGGEISPMSHKEISQKLIGKKHSQESKDKRAKTLKQNLLNGTVTHGRKGKKLSEESKLKIKKAQLRIKSFGKCVICTTTGKKWRTLKMCWEELFINKFSLGHFRNMMTGIKTNHTSITYCK